MYDASLVKTIALDFDGVLCAIHKPWLEEYNRRTGESITPEDITDYNMAQFVKNPATLWASRTPKTYEKALPEFHALWMFVIQALTTMGHTVVVLTKERDPDLISAKRAWIDRWFLHLPMPLKLRTVDQECKSSVGVDYLVDDCPANVFAFGERAALFRQPWSDNLAATPAYTTVSRPDQFFWWLLWQFKLPIVANDAKELLATRHWLYTGIFQTLELMLGSQHIPSFHRFHSTLQPWPCEACENGLH